MMRLAYFSTPHGDLPLPFFMPIATRGVIKTLTTADIEKLGTLIILSNAYHLWLRPGLEVLREAHGLHSFMSWSGAILTDSGGFQVFSLEGLRKLTPDGVRFQSYLDGAALYLTPELCVDIQRIIGSDICMVLDVCTKLPATQEELVCALQLTTDWARRSKQRFLETREGSFNPGAKLFAIVQGGTDTNLRQQSAEELLEIGFDGYAIGGLSVGEPFSEACRILEEVVPLLPSDKPRYFMGGAQPHEIVAYYERGIDMFDCVLPTRNARHGLLYRWVHDDLSRPDFYEVVHLTNERWKNSQEPFCPEVPELARYAMGYVRHLFHIGEISAWRLTTLANLHFYLELMRKLRQ